MASFKSLILFLAFGLILCSALEMRKHSQEEDFGQGQGQEETPKDPKIKQTEAIGGYTGRQFDEWEQSLYQVERITINSGTWIDGIRLDYSNGQWSTRHGGRGGDQRSWNVPYGEHIAKIDLRAGDFIDSIQFITDKGSSSPKWGQNGGISYSIEIPAGYKIVGLFGGEGEFLDRIGFNIAPLQETNNHKHI